MKHFKLLWWRGCGGSAPRILNLCTRWRPMVNITLWPLLLPEKEPRYPSDTKLDVVSKEKNHCPYQKSNPDLQSVVTVNYQVLIL
jgi:hypothetical protein